MNQNVTLSLDVLHLGTRPWQETDGGEKTSTSSWFSTLFTSQDNKTHDQLPYIFHCSYSHISLQFVKNK